MIAPRCRLLTKELIMRVEAFTISYIYDDTVFHSISIIKVQAFRYKVGPFESNSSTFSESSSHFCGRSEIMSDCLKGYSLHPKPIILVI